MWPLATDDGVSIAKKLDLVVSNPTDRPDETVNLGLLTFVNGSVRANDIAGDGTTTTVVIAQKIIHEGFKRLDELEGSFVGGAINVKALSNEILNEGERICGLLDDQKQVIQNKEQLIKVAQIAVKDEKLGEIIGNMVWELGKYAYISVEDTYGNSIESEVINGVNFNGKPAVDWTFNEKREIDMADVGIIVTNKEITDSADFMRRVGAREENIFFDLNNEGIKTVVIFAPKFQPAILYDFARQWKIGYKIIPIKVPSLTNDQLEDIAIYSGASFVNSDKDISLSRLTLQDVGHATRVHLKGEKVSIYGGAGNKESTQKRVEALVKQLEKEEDDLFRKKLERRISALSNGVGRIRVGSETEIRRDYLVKKVEDGVNATIGALEDGIVRGGGLPLKEISEGLPDGHILKEALGTPFEQIARNCGKKPEEFRVSEDVFDPVKVVKTAVKMACSVASMMIMTEGTIALKSQTLVEDLQDSIRIDQRFKESLPERDREKDDGAWLRQVGDY